jgi:hypothetical protein
MRRDMALSEPAVTPSALEVPNNNNVGRGNSDMGMKASISKSVEGRAERPMAFPPPGQNLPRGFELMA